MRRTPTPRDYEHLTLFLAIVAAIAGTALLYWAAFGEVAP